MECEYHIVLKYFLFQMKNVAFQSKILDFDKKTPGILIKFFEILGFSHNELEILGILSEMLGISKTWSFV